jgi:hypothetical protein
MECKSFAGAIDQLAERMSWCRCNQILGRFVIHSVGRSCDKISQGRAMSDALAASSSYDFARSAYADGVCPDLQNVPSLRDRPV